MPTFTVHQPPPRKGESAADPERFAFVRDGFHFWAFVLAPLWLIARRLWLVLVLYVLVTIAVDIGLALLGASTTAQVMVSLAIALLVGLEASTLRRWTLQRRKWKMLGFVVGDDEEAAERRFYASDWFKHGNSYYFIMTGLTLLVGLFAASQVVSMAGPLLGFLSGMLMALGVVVTWAALSIGLGAVLISRAGTRPTRLDGVAEPEIFAEEAHV